MQEIATMWKNQANWFHLHAANLSEAVVFQEGIFVSHSLFFPTKATHLYISTRGVARTAAPIASRHSRNHNFRRMSQGNQMIPPSNSLPHPSENI